jgi:hypothetical protein
VWRDPAAERRERWERVEEEEGSEAGRLSLYNSKAAAGSFTHLVQRRGRYTRGDMGEQTVVLRC